MIRCQGGFTETNDGAQYKEKIALGIINMKKHPQISLFCDL